METIPAFTRRDLTDAQWAALEPLLPHGEKPGRPPGHPKRWLIAGIRYRTQAGVPWRDVPSFYGPWQCVYWLYRRWQRGDSPQFAAVLSRIRVPRIGPGRPRTTPDRVPADRAYSSKANRALLARRGVKAVIPVKDDQKAHCRKKGSHGGREHAFDREAYKLRHAVECGINRLKWNRAVATPYDKLAVRYEATVQVAAINGWL